MSKLNYVPASGTETVTINGKVYTNPEFPMNRVIEVRSGSHEVTGYPCIDFFGYSSNSSYKVGVWVFTTLDARDTALTAIANYSPDVVFTKAQRIGTATLVAGTVTVSTASWTVPVTSESVAILSMNTPGGTTGTNHKSVIDAEAETLVITAVGTNGALVNTDTSTINYMVVEKGV